MTFNLHAREAEHAEHLAGYPAPLQGVALAQTWDQAWRALGRSAPANLCEQLLQAWSEPHRHYHDLRHLGECLALWERWKDEAERPAEVAIALWFHDAIYDPKSDDNEINSAAWAARSLAAANLSSEVAQRVYDLVMATRHDAAVQGRDAQLLVDIDLSILGSPAERFEEYDHDVSSEYAKASGFLYCSKRAQVLQGLNDRPQLYHCAPALALLEAQARVNLDAALTRLAQ
ncbi:MAG: N-methyl-D-aspartate receptor NMDAR2C subunit [Burkholderiaceae bacterium]|nr:N-methyl-D-aspartate receptor NMDAR2C subunit [Burkholderiaceae bacterium]